MPIFDDRVRTRIGGAREGDAAFAYLDESSRPEAARVRALLNGMANRYPEVCRAALVARIQDAAAHVDAVFELLVHEWCLRCGMVVLAVEPAVPGTAKTPDFLIEYRGRPFYLECVVARGESDLDAGARRRREAVLRAIDDVPSPDFLLGVETEGAPVRPAPLNALTGRIIRWLASLGYDQILTMHFDARPSLELDAEGMLLTIRPLPRDASRGDVEGRTTGILADGIREVSPWNGMRSAVLRKAKRYGELDLPLVVALGAMNATPTSTMQRKRSTAHGRQLGRGTMAGASSGGPMACGTDRPDRSVVG